MHRVLCVEDEAAFREDVADFLRLHSFDVDEAASGVEAIEQINRKMYDLVLCDIKMPGLSGFDVLDKLRHSEGAAKTLPFMFLTAQNDKDYQLRAHRLNCDEFLTKPIDLEVLVSAIESRIARQEILKRAIGQASFNFDERMVLAIHNETLIPLEELSQITRHSIQMSKGKVTAALQCNLEITDQVLRRQTIGLTTALSALSLHHQTENVAKSIIPTERIFASATPEHTRCDSKFVMGHADHLTRAIREFLASGIIAEPKDKWVLLEEETLETRITIADSKLPASDSRGPSVRFDEQVNLEKFLPLLKERMVALLYADAVARRHGGYLSLTQIDAKLAVTLHLPKEAVH
jgi:CheY-like chemotaxis protein